jgi:outer membrane protein, multidrug efflux system
MISTRLLHLLSIAITIVLMAGCKLREQQPAVALKIPESYRAPADTAAAAAISWKEFFSDAQLLRLIDEALRNNPDLNTAVQRVELARSQSMFRRGAILPSLTAVATAGQRKFGEYTMDGIGNYDTNFSDNIGDDKRIPRHLPDYFLGLQSSWELDVWGKLRNQKKAAYARVLSSESGRQWVMTALVAEVATLYYELLTLDNELKIVHQNIALQEKAVEVIGIQKQAGRANELAVKQFRAQLLNTRALEGGIKQQITEAESQMNLLLGRFTQPVPRGLPILEHRLPEALRAGIPSQMLRRRPDVRQAELGWMATQAEQRAAHAAFFPTLTLTSSVGLQAFNTSFLFSTPGAIAYNVLGGLTAPLFDRNRLRADYKISVAFQKQEFYSYQKTVLVAFQEVVNNLSRIDNLRDVSTLKEEEVTVLKNAALTANDLFVTGYASYLEVVSAQKGVLEAELALTETRKQQFQAMITLYKSLGGGWE